MDYLIFFYFNKSNITKKIALEVGGVIAGKIPEMAIFGNCTAEHKEN